MAPLSLILIIMAVSGFAYAHWSQSLYISGTVTTGIWDDNIVIKSYKVLSPDYDEHVGWRDKLDPKKRTFQITPDNVFSSWYAWVGLKLHNEPPTRPANVWTPTYEFEPSSAKDNFEIVSYFYGPYRYGQEVPKEVWPQVEMENLPIEPWSSPPIPIDTSARVIVWIYLHSTDNLGEVQITIRI